MKKILKTLKNISDWALYVRNSDWIKTSIASWWTFVSYKAKELMRMYKKYFSVEADEWLDSYKITAISETEVQIVDKKWKEVISMKVEVDEQTEEATLYLWIWWTWKEESDSTIIALIEELIDEVVDWDNIVKKSDAETLVAEYNSLT